MDHNYVMDPLDHKQAQAPINQMRRVYYGDDHDLLRQQNAIDLKYPFPQAHLYPTSSSVRGAPVSSNYLPPGQNQGSGQAAEVHMDDPRYVPQDLMSLMRDMDDKRMRGYYGYPMATQNSVGMLGGAPLNPGVGQAGSQVGGQAGGQINGQIGGQVGGQIQSQIGSQIGGLVANNSGQNAPNGSLSGSLTGALTANVGNPASAASAASSLLPPGTQMAKKDEHGLVLPIPPLHVQQQIANNEDKVRKAETENVISSKCSRCKKDFVQRLIMPKDSNGDSGAEPKVYKLCHHCRDLQRQRLRRWQKKTKDKQGACRRCGTEIPPEEQKYVLCPQCRENLRIRKANRAAQGKCVHCSGPINALIIKEEGEDGRRSLTLGSYKVCQRCRENDKIRRTNLERMGNCNRCAKALLPSEQGKHKVCLSCRQKKKKSGLGLYSGPSGPPVQQPMVGDVALNVMVQPMNFIPPEQAAMMMGLNSVGMSQVPQQEYPVTYGNYQPMLQAPQFQQMQGQDGQMHGFQAARSYQRDRM